MRAWVRVCVCVCVCVSARARFGVGRGIKTTANSKLVAPRSNVSSGEDTKLDITTTGIPLSLTSVLQKTERMKTTADLLLLAQTSLPPRQKA